MTDKALMLIAKSISPPETVDHLRDAEFRVFSQWGDDGIIQFLVKNVDVSNDFFVEFGVEDYEESNTRFLLMNNNWSGFVMDGSSKHIDKIKNASYFWKYDLQASQSFVTKENIVEKLHQNCPEKIGLLHIDIDGVDYWIWKEIGKHFKPDILILEYNSVFGKDRAITVPYSTDFQRLKAHHTGLYAGASLKAMVMLSKEYGYCFLGCNSVGNNAYFVREDCVNKKLPVSDVEDGFVESKFRESRNQQGKLTYLRAEQRLDAVRGMPVINVENDQIEKL